MNSVSISYLTTVSLKCPLTRMGNSILYIVKSAKDLQDLQESNEIMQALLNKDTMNSISDKPPFYWTISRKGTISRFV